MAENENGQEKTEQPTAKRLQDAREKGQAPRSKDLNATAIMLLGAFGLILMGPDLIQGLMEIFKKGLLLEREALMDKHHVLIFLAQVLLDALWLLMPFLALMLFAALSAPLILGGWIFSTKALVPDIKKLDPVAGFKRIFSLKGLVELLKALGKFLIVGGIAAILFYFLSDEFLALGAVSVFAGFEAAGWYIFGSFIALSLGMVIIAAVDVPFQVWQHRKQLRMSRQEVKQELRDTEGKPEVKSKIRSLQQQLAQARMMDNVPDADIVITNPTHYSVALKYEQNAMKAPVVVAKGVDLIALRIRELAAEHGVAVISSPQLSRALYASTELQKEIPSPLYLAVAQIMAFVYQLKTARARGEAKPKAPRPDIPEDFLDFLRRQGNEV